MIKLRNLGYKVKQPAYLVFATALLWIKVFEKVTFCTA